MSSKTTGNTFSNADSKTKTVPAEEFNTNTYIKKTHKYQ